MSDRCPNPLAWIVPLSALALAAGILLGRGVGDWLPGMLILASAMLLAALFHGRARRAAVLLAVLALGFLRGFAAYHPSLPEEDTYLVSGVVADELHEREDGQVRTILREVALNDERIASGAYWTGYPKTLPENIQPGTEIAVTAEVYHPSRADNPGGFDFQEYLLQQDIAIGIYGMNDVAVTGSGFMLSGWAARVRNTLSEGLVRAMGEEAGAYAAAMLLGNRALIASEDREAFNRLGIAHVLSVSGYHVGVLAGLLALLFKRLKIQRWLRTLITAAVLAAYCVLTGMNPPVIRASVLVVLYQIGRLQHRQNIGLHVLSASAILMLLVSPAQLVSASFQFTYAAMLGLILVLPELERRFAPKGCRFRRVKMALCATTAAQLGILLPQIYWFQQLPLLALPLNIIVLAGAGAIISLYWLILALLAVPSVASIIGAVVGLITECLLHVIRALGNIPGIVLWVKQANIVTFAGWALLMATLSILWVWKRWRKRLALLGAVMIALSLIPWPYAGARYIQFDVGSADAALLQDKGLVAAIDAGEDGIELADYLKRNRLSLDLLFLTHLHSDHAGGIRALLDNGIPVKTVCLAEGARSAEVDESMLALLEELLNMGAELRTLARGDTIALPDGAITVVWPEGDKVRGGMDANLHSLVMLMEIKGTTVLLTGDLDGGYERYAAAPADILKVAHHGSTASTSQEFLEAVNPGLLILSCGDATRQKSMEERRGDIPLYGTREHGAITIEFQDDGYTVTTAH